VNRFAAIEGALSRTHQTWEVVPLKRLATLREDPDIKGAASLLSLKNTGALAPRGDDVQPPSDEHRLRYLLTDAGDLVVNPMWLAGGAIGVSSVSGAVSPDYRVYSLSAQVEPRFVHHLFRSAPYHDQYRLLMRAETTFDRRVTKEDFAQLPVLLPPLDIQRGIAEFLDAETVRIDALIEKRQQMIALVRERFAATRRGLFDHLASAYGEIALRRCVRCLDGRRIPLNAEARAERSGPFPYWGAGNVVDHIDDYLFDEVLVLLGEDGAPFFDKARDVAFYVEGRVWVNNHIHVLRPNSSWLPRYLVHMLNAVDYGAYITGSTRDKLTQAEMNDIRLPATPVEDQHRIVEQLEISFRMLEDVRNRLTRQVSLLREHRQALITAAVTGQLDVSKAAA
jgi:type I restriction enzyme S subunit